MQRKLQLLSRCILNLCETHTKELQLTRRLHGPSSQRNTTKQFKPSNFQARRPVPSHVKKPSYAEGGSIFSVYTPEVKSQLEVNNMRPACKLASSILDFVEKNTKIGMTTNDIDDMVHSKCIDAGAYPSPLNYKGFPKSVCTSVNHVACHGIPSDLVLQDGDIINVDITVFHQGYHGDTSRTFLIGNVDERSKILVQTAKDCRDIGIGVCQHGAPFSDIGEAIYSTALEAGFEVIPNFCGHGIGKYFHGPPDIIHVPHDSPTGQQMLEGMTFTVEPILCDGSPEISILSDDWTVVTVDGSRSAQFEHTILVTRYGYEILT